MTTMVTLYKGQNCITHHNTLSSLTPILGVVAVSSKAELDAAEAMAALRAFSPALFRKPSSSSSAIHISRPFISQRLFCFDQMRSSHWPLAHLVETKRTMIDERATRSLRLLIHSGRTNSSLT